MRTEVSGPWQKELRRSFAWRSRNMDRAESSLKPGVNWCGSNGRPEAPGRLRKAMVARKALRRGLKANRRRRFVVPAASDRLLPSLGTPDPQQNSTRRISWPTRSSATALASQNYGRWEHITLERAGLHQKPSFVEPQFLLRSGPPGAWRLPRRSRMGPPLRRIGHPRTDRVLATQLYNLLR